MVSTPGERCILAEIKHFFLLDPEFMSIHLKIIPQKIIDAYNLTALVEDQGWIYMHIEKGMYFLKQARIIYNQELVNHMTPLGYHPVQHTPGLWVHDSREKLVLWSTILVFNVSQQRMPTIFYKPSDPNFHHSRHGSDSLHRY